MASAIVVIPDYWICFAVTILTERGVRNNSSSFFEEVEENVPPTSSELP
jgi:hypothetical protein